MNEFMQRTSEYFLTHAIEWLIFPVVIVVGYFVVRTINKCVSHFFDRVDYDRTLEVLILNTLNVFLWIVVVIIALANIGFDVSGFIAGLGVMGFIVGFAVKDVLSNLAAGLFLLVKRPFTVDEIIDVAGVKGRVEQMTLSSCSIITEDRHTHTPISSPTCFQLAEYRPEMMSFSPIRKVSLA
jgi:small conductance mechanosensitive channel